MTTLATLPSVHKTLQSMIIKEHGITLLQDTELSDQENMVIQGVFVLPRPLTAINVHAQPHKSLVLTVNSSGRYTVKRPYYEVVCFPDDIQQSEKSKKGYFQLNISSYINTNHSGVYYIMCSLGTYLSNILPITID